MLSSRILASLLVSASITLMHSSFVVTAFVAGINKRTVYNAVKARRIHTPKFVASFDPTDNILIPADDTELNEIANKFTQMQQTSISLDSSELPKHYSQRTPESLVRSFFIPSIEIVLGRTAMVAALIFFGVEFTTGMSFPEQINRVIDLLK
mmetsp:Transcript_54612/g.81074  ORF Transcript_54612/g.81074 Transcript_54612/m.81074 type:complete len:152 (-) Transcript_54612:170-625(-)